MDIDDGERWYEQFGERIGRRSMLRGGLLAVAGLAAGALIGCGDDDDDDDDEAAPATPTAAATATPTAEAAKPAPAEESWYSKNARDDGAPYDYGYEEPDTPPKAGVSCGWRSPGPSGPGTRTRHPPHMRSVWPRR